MASNYVSDGYLSQYYVQTGVTVNWILREIFIPKSELTLVQTNPIEVYNMDLNDLRLILKDLESTDGMPFPDTHRHNTTVAISGITLARVIEFINNYTITLEDGQYAVNFIGANSNIADVINPNQVSIRVSNSAGLIQAEVSISEPDLNAIASKVWDEQTSDHTINGSFGQYFTTKILTIKKFLGLKNV